MYQVTILFQDAEIAYGEGDSLSYAKQEATDSLVGGFYEGLSLEDMEFSVVDTDND